MMTMTKRPVFNDIDNTQPRAQNDRSPSGLYYKPNSHRTRLIIEHC